MASGLDANPSGVWGLYLRNRICRRRILAALLILMIGGRARCVFANSLSFPPTTFAILNPDTGATIGQSRYSVESTADGAILHGESSFYDGQSDVETGKLLGVGEGLPKLVEFDHTFYNSDHSIQERAHADLRSGAATCSGTSSGTKSDSTTVLDFPADTWAGASIVIPVQHFLRAGDKDLPSLHIFNCAPDPKIFAISLQTDPGLAVWAPYGGQTLRVEVRPDFGWLNVLVAAFVPRLHAWFDPGNGWAFVGDEAARYYQGSKIMLVKKARGVASASKLTTTR
jgi:hypothetical protein